MIQRIEQFNPKLNVDSFVVDVIVLEQRHVKIIETGSDGDISSAIAQSGGRLWRDETLRLDVVSRVAGIHGIVATSQAQPVGKVKCRGVIGCTSVMGGFVGSSLFQS